MRQLCSQGGWHPLTHRYPSRPPLRPSTDAHLLPGPGHSQGAACLCHPCLEVRDQPPPHRDDGVALALLGQVSNTTHEEPVGRDVGLASLDHATAQLDQLRMTEGATFSWPARGGPRLLQELRPQAGVPQGPSGPGTQPCEPALPVTHLEPGGQQGGGWVLAPEQKAGAGQRSPDWGTQGPGGHAVLARGLAGPASEGAQGCYPSLLPLLLPCPCPRAPNPATQ